MSRILVRGVIPPNSPIGVIHGPINQVVFGVIVQIRLKSRSISRMFEMSVVPDLVHCDISIVAKEAPSHANGQAYTIKVESMRTMVAMTGKGPCTIRAI